MSHKLKALRDDLTIQSHNKMRCANGGFNYFDVLLRLQQSFPNVKVKEYMGFLLLTYKTYKDTFTIQVHFPTTNNKNKANEFMVRVDTNKAENVYSVINVIRWIEQTKIRLDWYNEQHNLLKYAEENLDNKKIRSINLNLFINGCY